MVDSLPPSNISSDWMVFIVKLLRVSHCKGLDQDDTSGSSLDRTLHRLTPNTIYSMADSIYFDLIDLLYYNIYFSIDDTSDDILTRVISYMGNLS